MQNGEGSLFYSEFEMRTIEVMTIKECPILSLFKKIQVGFPIPRTKFEVRRHSSKSIHKPTVL